MRKVFLRITGAAFLLCVFANTSAQKQVETQRLFWMRYSLKAQLSDNLFLRQEIEERTYWFPWRQHQFLTRTMAERTLGKGWSAGLGLAFFQSAVPQDPQVKDYINIAELRPLFELAYVQKISGKFSIHHRYWSEFRFFEQPDGGFAYRNNRTRYRLEVQYAIRPKLVVRAFDEIHLNIGGDLNVFDQNRFGTSLNFTLWRNIAMEAGYIQWFQQQQNQTDYFRRHIFRFTVFHTMDWRSITWKGEGDREAEGESTIHPDRNH